MDEHLILERIARGVERGNQLLEMLVRLQSGEDHCPECGSGEMENTSTMGHPQMTCLACHAVFEASPEGH